MVSLSVLLITIIIIVDDNIVIDLVKAEIQGCETNGESWILQGFPRTKVQALALQRSGHIPDKIILLNIDQAVSLERMRSKLPGGVGGLSDKERDDISAQQL